MFAVCFCRIPSSLVLGQHLEEPTTGLHLADIEQPLLVLQKLRDQGNTILVIEHNLDVIKVADHIIDLGPEGGDQGGTVIAAGTPEQVAAVKNSYTGQYLRPLLPAITDRAVSKKLSFRK